MIANYGYSDAEGEYYITLDTSLCAACKDKPCLPACPRLVFVPEEDPYGEHVVAVADAARKKLKYECSPCKPAAARPPLPCQSACPYSAMRHSW